VTIVIQSRVEDPDRIEWRREQIVRAAVRCFASDGYHRTTIKDIADTAGFSSGLIYSYVKDKEDVLFLVFRLIFETYQREIPRRLEGITDPLQRFCTAVRAYCEAVDSNLGATVVGYHESGSLRPALLEAVQKMELETNRLISEPVEACIAAGHFRAVNVDLLTFRVVFLAHGWALKHWHFARIVSLEGYIEEGLNLFLNALLTPAGRRHWQRRAKDWAAAAAQATAARRPARARRPSSPKSSRRAPRSARATRKTASTKPPR